MKFQNKCIRTVTTFFYRIPTRFHHYLNYLHLYYITLNGYEHNYYDPKLQISVIPQIIFKRQKHLLQYIFTLLWHIVHCVLYLMGIFYIVWVDYY
jgi:hypothetical protein